MAGSKKIVRGLNLRPSSRDPSLGAAGNTGRGRSGGFGMIKIFAAVFGAALLAGAVVVIPGLSPKVEAHMLSAKGDRLDLKTYGPACSQRGWPYYESSCVRDTASPTRQARPVRMVGTDRLPAISADRR
jgi:hypothetical protein